MSNTDTQEIIRSIGELKSETVYALATLQGKVDGIHRRLDHSNSRIAKHEETIQELRLQSSQLDTELGHLRSEHEGRIARNRQVGMAMLERLFWLVGSIVLALVVHFAGL